MNFLDNIFALAGVTMGQSGAWSFDNSSTAGPEAATAEEAEVAATAEAEVSQSGLPPSIPHPAASAAARDGGLEREEGSEGEGVKDGEGDGSAATRDAATSGTGSTSTSTNISIGDGKSNSNTGNDNGKMKGNKKGKKTKSKGRSDSVTSVGSVGSVASACVDGGGGSGGGGGGGGGANVTSSLFHVATRLRWGDVEEYLFSRDVSRSAVPNSGGYPLGLGAFVGSERRSVDDQCSLLQGDLIVRARYANAHPPITSTTSSSTTASNAGSGSGSSASASTSTNSPTRKKRSSSGCGVVHKGPVVALPCVSPSGEPQPLETRQFDYKQGGMFCGVVFPLTPSRILSHTHTPTLYYTPDTLYTPHTRTHANTLGVHTHTTTTTTTGKNPLFRPLTEEDRLVVLGPYPAQYECPDGSNRDKLVDLNRCDILYSLSVCCLYATSPLCDVCSFLPRTPRIIVYNV